MHQIGTTLSAVYNGKECASFVLMRGRCGVRDGQTMDRGEQDVRCVVVGNLKRYLLTAEILFLGEFTSR
jgi:hypothetical protein